MPSISPKDIVACSRDLYAIKARYMAEIQFLRISRHSTCIFFTTVGTSDLLRQAVESVGLNRKFRIYNADLNRWYLNVPVRILIKPEKLEATL